MHQSALRGFVLLVPICLCQFLRVPLDHNGWKSLPLDKKGVVDSMSLAADHLGGTVKDPVTAFKLTEDVPEWDIFRVSFRGRFQKGQGYECHADVIWIRHPPNVTVFNTGCMAVTLHPELYSGGPGRR